jgi:hypothetical protein
LGQFLEEASLVFNQTSDKFLPIEDWVQDLDLGGRKFTFDGHEYEVDMLKETAPRQCYKKGAQMGITEVNVLKTLHGLLFGRYPQGVLYLFPTVNDVTDFSRGRFGPLVGDNEEINKQVQTTDAVGVKRIRKSMLYLRGARVTGKIEGIKRTSSQLKGVPVDRLVCDEVDEMESSMVDLAVERLGHSLVKEEAYLSTPSIPDFGIDKLYNESDQRVWMLKCSHCGAETCLELEFPTCLLELPDGKVIRVCKACKKEIYPKDGRWVAQHPGRDLVGWWISQLNSIYVEPGKILRAFNDANKRNLQEFYNSKLGMAWISAENRLTVQDVYANCGQSPMLTRANGPCCMGIDVGTLLHVVVAYKPREEVLQVCYLAQVSSFNDLHDIAQRFNVRSAVVDTEPETRKAREWQASEEFPVFLCDYQSTITEGKRWDEEKKTLRVNRTESLDGVHHMIANSGLIVFPRRCEEVEEFAKQLVNTAKVLEEDQETGSREYKYRKLGPDHYAHALNYCILASSKISTMSDPWGREKPRQEKAVCEFDVYDYTHEKGVRFGDPQAKGETDWNPFD